MCFERRIRHLLKSKESLFVGRLHVDICTTATILRAFFCQLFSGWWKEKWKLVEGILCLRRGCSSTFRIRR